MADEEHINGIRALAWEHQGQYLLPRRLRPDPFNKTDTDLDYDACEELVRRGEARRGALDLWLFDRGPRHPNRESAYQGKAAYSDAPRRGTQQTRRRAYPR